MAEEIEELANNIYDGLTDKEREELADQEHEDEKEEEKEEEKKVDLIFHVDGKTLDLWKEEDAEALQLFFYEIIISMNKEIYGLYNYGIYVSTGRYFEEKSHEEWYYCTLRKIAEARPQLKENNRTELIKKHKKISATIRLIELKKEKVDKARSLLQVYTEAVKTIEKLTNSGAAKAACKTLNRKTTARPLMCFVLDELN